MIPFWKKVLVSAVFMAALTVHSFAATNEYGYPYYPVGQTGTVTLTWDAPITGPDTYKVTNECGCVQWEGGVPSTNIGFYEVGWATNDSGYYNFSISDSNFPAGCGIKSVAGNVLTAAVELVREDVYFFGVRAGKYGTNSVPTVRSDWSCQLIWFSVVHDLEVDPQPGLYYFPVDVVLTNRAWTKGITCGKPLTNRFIRAFYTLDGSLPTTNSAIYNGPITFTSNTFLTAAAANQATNVHWSQHFIRGEYRQYAAPDGVRGLAVVE